jgi:ankyrin repeat protein
MPSSIRKALNELPITLDDTYTRSLECIPLEKWRHAHRLFQCLIAAIRPLRVEELGEIFTIEFDSKADHKLVEDWRPLDAEDAILSVCSSLISVVDVEDSKVVQFSHFSVKEFLISDRLASKVKMVSQYYVRLEPAHGILARACLTVLLQLDKNMNKEQLGTFPLAFYAAEYWMDHTRFGMVPLEIEDAVVRLFDPRKSHLNAWIWIHDIQDGYRKSIGELEQHPPRLNGTPLHFAALCGFSWLVKHLIIMHAEDVNAQSDHDWCTTPLHWAYDGHRGAAMLLDNEGADAKSKTEDEPGIVHHKGHLEVMRVLLENGAHVDAQNAYQNAVSHLAAQDGEVEILQLLIQYKADINARARLEMTPLHGASLYGHIKTVQLLLEYGADANLKNEDGNTPLSLATRQRNVEVVRLLLEHGADVHIRNLFSETAFQMATRLSHHDIAQLLLEHGAEGEEDRNE